MIDLDAEKRTSELALIFRKTCRCHCGLVQMIILRVTPAVQLELGGVFHVIVGARPGERLGVYEEHIPDGTSSSALGVFDLTCIDEDIIDFYRKSSNLLRK